MSDNQKDKPTFSMKVLKGPKQSKRENDSKSIPIKRNTIAGAELAEKLNNKNLISEENGKDWLSLTKEARSELKLPDIKWD